ncbi:hypothetical protein J2W17_002475 [Pseudomonas lini]|uniref:hypothetical protein n=1 Tax=Pseudomonas lini TaxID=163011 RepID=UPI00278242B5|nr:hypothetical protein [Pseudomonas lini]MDQ0123528.1 hypothetical protein [Pseudomonas lini]
MRYRQAVQAPLNVKTFLSVLPGFTRGAEQSSPGMFVLLHKGEILIDVFLRPMFLPQERLAQRVESHGFLERQASKDFVALMVFTEGSYFPEVRALHVREHKHLDLLSIATAELCRNAQSCLPTVFQGSARSSRKAKRSVRQAHPC